MKKYILLIFVIMGACSLWAQSPPQIKPLTIGDTVPDITFNHILNYKDSTAKLSDFKGKAVILDFFATWCGACIAALPRLDSLQKRFKSDLQVIILDYETAEKVNAFLQLNNIGKSVSLPFILSDNILRKYFPHKIIPHEVWINKHGRVAAITGADYLTGKDIQTFLGGEALHWPIKNDVMDFDPNEPLLKDGNGGDFNNLLFRSTLTKHLDGMFSGFGEYISKDSATRRIYYINYPILALYSAAKDTNFDNRIILHVKDTAKFINTGAKDWYGKNSYCYELIVPLWYSDERIQSIMLTDLNRFFQLKEANEEHFVACFSLVRKDANINGLKSKGGAPRFRLMGSYSDVKYIQNEPISVLIDAMNSQIMGEHLHPIIVDNTEYRGRVDMQLIIRDIHNIPMMKKALNAYGFDLVPVRKNISFFVLTQDDK